MTIERIQFDDSDGRASRRIKYTDKDGDEFIVDPAPRSWCSFLYDIIDVKAELMHLGLDPERISTAFKSWAVGRKEQDVLKIVLRSVDDKFWIDILIHPLSLETMHAVQREIHPLRDNFDPHSLIVSTYDRAYADHHFFTAVDSYPIFTAGKN